MQHNPACCAVGGVTANLFISFTFLSFPSSLFLHHTNICFSRTQSNFSQSQSLSTFASDHSTIKTFAVRRTYTLATSNTQSFLIYQPSPCLPSRTSSSPWHSPPSLLRKAKSQTVKFRLPHRLSPPFLRSQTVRSRLPPKLPQLHLSPRSPTVKSKPQPRPPPPSHPSLKSPTVRSRPQPSPLPSPLYHPHPPTVPSPLVLLLLLSRVLPAS